MAITNFIVNTDFPQNVYQGDYFDFELTVNANLTGYKCRANIYDIDGNDIQLASSNITGGSDSEVLITSSSISTIKVFVAKDLTDNFNENSFVEVEIEDASGKVYTILNYNFKINKENLTWTEPS